MRSCVANAPALRATPLRAPRVHSLRRAAPVAARGAMRACAASLAEQYNFGAASSLDTTVFGSCRPGGAGGDEQTPAGSLGDAVVAEWAAVMKAQGITRVVSLLDDVELTAYATPLHEQYGRLFTRHDLVKMSHDPDESRAAHAKLLDAFSDAQRAGERVVVHCRGGQSRTGLALSAWLVHAHKLSAADAAAEVERAAAEQKLVRFAKAAKITAFTGAA